MSLTRNESARWAALLALSLAAFPLVGCTSSDRGTLTGHLMSVGGPAGVPSHPMDVGAVTVHGPGGDHTVPVSTSGRYTLTLRPGTYTVTGRSPGFLDGRGGCSATAEVTVNRGRTSGADVFCQLR